MTTIYDNTEECKAARFYNNHCMLTKLREKYILTTQRNGAIAFDTLISYEFTHGKPMTLTCSLRGIVVKFVLDDSFKTDIEFIRCLAVLLQM